MIIDWRLYGRTLYGSQWPISVRIMSSSGETPETGNPQSTYHARPRSEVYHARPRSEVFHARPR